MIAETPFVGLVVCFYPSTPGVKGPVAAVITRAYDGTYEADLYEFPTPLGRKGAVRQCIPHVSTTGGPDVAKPYGWQRLP